MDWVAVLGILVYGIEIAVIVSAMTIFTAWVIIRMRAKKEAQLAKTWSKMFKKEIIPAVEDSMIGMTTKVYELTMNSLKKFSGTDD